MSINTDCTTAAVPVHGVVEFDAAAFKLTFPEFTAVADARLILYFVLATAIVDNTCRSPVSNAIVREQMLNLLVAHMAAIVPNDTGLGQIVGRISQATEGSVSVAAQYATHVSQSMAWFVQTQYGAAFWQLTSPYRSFRYVAPVQCCGPAGALAGRRG